MYTAGGFSALLRGFRLALTVEGLRPHTIRFLVREGEIDRDRTTDMKLVSWRRPLTVGSAQGMR